MNNFSYTKVDTFRNCPRMFYLKYILGLQPKVKGRALALGYLMAKAIEEFRKEGNVERAVDVMLTEWKTPEGNVLPLSIDDDPTRSLERAIEIFREYTEEYPNEHEHMVKQEIKFQHPLDLDGQEIIFEGIIDGVIETESGYAIIEDKTTSRLGDSYFTNKMADFQVRWYMMVASEMGLFDIKNSVALAVINAIYVHHTNLKYQRKLFSISKSSIKEAKNALLDWVKLIKTCIFMNHYPQNFGHCPAFNGCPYSCLRGVKENSSLWNNLMCNFSLREDRHA